MVQEPGTSKASGCDLQAALEKVANLEQALRSSRRIGMAMGILMTTRKVSADDAFELLRQTSQRHNRKVRDIAMDVVELGCLPEYSRRAPTPPQ